MIRQVGTEIGPRGYATEQRASQRNSRRQGRPNVENTKERVGISHRGRKGRSEKRS
jgi:hypothetical protein